MVKINIGHVLQAFVGSPRLPTNIDCGVIEFDHESKSLPVVNTCALSICFSNTARLTSYEQFVKVMLCIVVVKHVELGKQIRGPDMSTKKSRSGYDIIIKVDVYTFLQRSTEHFNSQAFQHNL